MSFRASVYPPDIGYCKHEVMPIDMKSSRPAFHIHVRFVPNADLQSAQESLVTDET